MIHGSIATRHNELVLIQDPSEAYDAEDDFRSWQVADYENDISKPVRITMSPFEWENLAIRARAMGISQSALASFCIAQVSKHVPGDILPLAEFENRLKFDLEEE